MKPPRPWPLALLLLACSGVDPSERVAIAPLDDLEAFRPLALALGAGCASLDCHGHPARNLRLYDARGMRLRPEDRPGEGVTSDDELRASHRSLVALEAGLTSQVIAEHGASPERLLLVRKARGDEAHKGGRVWPPLGPGDRCLLSWLAGSIDSNSCVAAATIEPIP